MINNVCTYIIGCVIEENIDYFGNTVSRMTEPDVDSCRSSCSLMGAPYFSYKPNAKFDQNKCKCKDSDAGRRAKDGTVSGETSCDDTSDQPTSPPSTTNSPTGKSLHFLYYLPKISTNKITIHQEITSLLKEIRAVRKHAKILAMIAI